MNKKYELIDETQEWNGRILHRIRALADFGDVKAGELGGWIEKEENLSVSEHLVPTVPAEPLSLGQKVLLCTDCPASLRSAAAAS